MLVRFGRPLPRLTVLLILLAGCGKAPTKPHPTPGQAAWSLQRIGTPCVSIWAGSPSAVFAAGLSGRIVRYDGSTWTSQSSATTVNLWGIWGARFGRDPGRPRV